MQCVLITFTPTSSPPNSSQVHLYLPTSFQLHILFFLFKKPFSQICVFCVLLGVEPSTGMWSTYQRPRPLGIQTSLFQNPSPVNSFSAGSGGSWVPPYSTLGCCLACPVQAGEFMRAAEVTVSLWSSLTSGSCSLLAPSSVMFVGALWSGSSDADVPFVLSTPMTLPLCTVVTWGFPHWPLLTAQKISLVQLWPVKREEWRSSWCCGKSFLRGFKIYFALAKVQEVFLFLLLLFTIVFFLKITFKYM